MTMTNNQSYQPRSIIQKDKVKPIRTPGQKRQRKILLITIGVVAAVGVAAYYLLIPREDSYVLNSYETAVVEIGSLLETTQASGNVVIPVQATITAPNLGGSDGSGYVQALYVDSGDAVTKGQALAKLSVPNLEEDLEDLLTELDDVELTLEKSRYEYDFAEKRAAREIVRLQENVTEAQENVERLRKLVEINASRKSELEEAEDTLQSAEVESEEAEISLEEDRIMHDLSLKALEASVLRYRTRITRLQEDIAGALITSPIDGEVLEIEDILTVQGSEVTQGDALLTVADRSSAVIDLEVLEQYSGLLSKGQQVALSVGGVAMSGTIENIGKVATTSSDGLGATIQVRVIPEPGYQLLLGSSVVSEIALGEQENVLILPRGPYLTTGNQRYVFKVQGNKGVRTKVTYGDIQSDKVQILNGLEEGDTVIISGYQNYVEHETITLGGKK